MSDELRIRHYLKERFRLYEDSLSSADALDDVVDSLGLFELVEFVESEFGVSIPSERFSPARFSSIDNILDLVNEFRADNVAAGGHDVC